MPLWIAIALPRLALDVFLRANQLTEPSTERSADPLTESGLPHAAVDARKILAVDALAASLGMRPGMPLEAAYILAPQLIAKRREPALEQEALEAAATWACQFTPSVVIRYANTDLAVAGLLVEIEHSLKLFEGLASIRAGLAHGLHALGLASVDAVAPTARAAWWINRAGAKADTITTLASLEPALARLPIGVLDCSARTLAMLEAIGARTLGEVMALPRAGFARRFGPELLTMLDEARAQRPEAHGYFVPPERFHAKLELHALVENAAALVFAYRRLFVQLEGLLCARASGVTSLNLVMQHESRSIRVTTADSVLTIGLVAPAASAEHFIVLARERLERFTLPAPVHTIRLVADTLVPLAGGNFALFEDTLARDNDWAKLVERLRARLGTQAVHSLAIAAEHRPEYVVQRIEPATKPARATTSASHPLGPRPLWLLSRPRALLERNAQPYDNGPLSLLAGPERIESGWWDGADVTRDYFIAARADRSLVWVYRERGSATGRWYLHGLFA